MINYNIRKKININLSNKNKYEKFISSYIKEQIPRCLIENYSSIFKTIHNRNYQIKLIKYYRRQVFGLKLLRHFYIANQTVNSSSQLDYFQHGAEYGYQILLMSITKNLFQNISTHGLSEKSKRTIPYKITKINYSK